MSPVIPSVRNCTTSVLKTCHMVFALFALTADRSGPKIVCQVLVYPMTSTNAEGSTYKTYIYDPYLPPVLLQWMYDAFFGDRQKLDPPNSDSSLSSCGSLERMLCYDEYQGTTQEIGAYSDHGDCYRLIT